MFTLVTCQQCRNEFKPTNKRGKTPKFCSNACKQRNYRKSRNTQTQAGKQSKPKRRNRNRQFNAKSRNTRLQAGEDTKPVYDANKEGRYEMGPDGCFVAYWKGEVRKIPEGWGPGISEAGSLTYYMVKAQ